MINEKLSCVKHCDHENLKLSIILFQLALACIAVLASCVLAGGHGGGHKKVVIHVPVYVKHHHHKHTIVKHVHHKHGGGGGDDHYEVLGYTYGEPKHSAPHFGGGKCINKS